MSKWEIIEPLALAARGRTLEGRLPLSSLTRLMSLLSQDETAADSTTLGDVEYLLEFGMDVGNSPIVTGSVKATLPIICQRCMGSMGFAVTTRTQLGIVSSRAAAEKLPDRYDPLLVLADEEMTIASIIEDELILALPQVAMHSSKECPKGDAFLKVENGEENVSAPRRENPFAMLAQLKTSQSKNND